MSFCLILCLFFLKYFQSFEFEKGVEKMKNSHDKFLIKSYKTFPEEISGKQTNKLKNNNLNRIDTYVHMRKLKQIKKQIKRKNQKSFFKPIVISKDKMDN